jgi:hypothetical protein
MKKIGIITLVLFFSLCLTNIYSQSIGKLYDKDEADQKYGPVLESAEISRVDMESMLRITSKVIMFKFVEGELIILGDNRKLLTSTKTEIHQNDEFYMFTIDKVIELMVKGNSNSVFVEQRTTKLTITNGAFTLQESLLCPPFCLDDQYTTCNFLFICIRLASATV